MSIIRLSKWQVPTSADYTFHGVRIRLPSLAGLL
jgi:hypothetical protein